MASIFKTASNALLRLRKAEPSAVCLLQCHFGLDGLSQGSDDPPTLNGIPEHRLVLGIAEIARFEQHRRSVRPAQHLEGREAVGLGAKLDLPGRLAEQANR